MKLRKLLPWTVILVGVGVPRLAWADDATARSADDAPPRPPIVVRYEAPSECPRADAFAASVRAELAGRHWDSARPLQVHVVVATDGQGYTAAITSNPGGGASLERAVSAPTCIEAAEMAAAIVTLAQGDAPDVEVTPAAAPPRSPQRLAVAAPPNDAPKLEGSAFSYSLTLGYGAFTSGPATPVAYASQEQTTFNPAQGVRLGLGVTHALGWWKHSLNLSAAYYRQSTRTVPVAQWPTTSGNTPLANGISLDDRDVLLATIDACPVHLDYEFMSLIPCATFSMMQSRGQNGNNPGLETGLGGSARLRATSGWFFAELMGTAVAVSSSYEPPSQSVRAFYAISLGVQFR
jgi:hypothetical protein